MLTGKIRRKLRGWNSLAHTWLGLTTGLLVCLLSVSGAVIAFRPQIEDAMAPKSAELGSCPAVIGADRAVQSVAAYSPGASLERIVFPVNPKGDWRLQVSDSRRGVSRLAYSPCSGRILGKVNVAWVDWLVDLHHNLLAGKTGRKVVGAIGIGFFCMIVSGLVVWLTSNPKWRQVLQIRRSGSFRRWVFDTHRSAGLAAMLVLALQISTGIWLAYPQTFQAALAWMVPAKASAKAKGKKEKGRRRDGQAAVSTLLDAAIQAMPDGQLRELRLPDADAKTAQVRLWRAGDLRTSGNNTIILNASTAALVSVDRFADFSPAQKLMESVTPIHYGELAGIGSRVLLGVAGLVPPVLFVSGFLIWWLPKRAKVKRSEALDAERVFVQ